MGSGADHCLCQPRYCTSRPLLIVCFTMLASRDTRSDVDTLAITWPQRDLKEINQEQEAAQVHGVVMRPKWNSKQ